MTYGTYQVYPSGKDGSHHCIEIPDNIHQAHAYRKWTHVYSHLRTHRAFLFKQIKREDLIDSRSGEFYTEATDCAYLFYLAELCGNKDKIKLIDDILLTLNRENPNQAAGNLKKQKDTERHIRKQTPYNIIQEPNFVTSNLAGGLGNLLFEIANAYSFGLRYNLKCKFDFNHSLPNQGTKVDNYYDNILKKVQFNNFDKSNFKIIDQRRFEHDEYPYTGGNICFNGYYQSYKYFEEYESEIRSLFECPIETKRYILKKYGKLLDRRTVSIHVRRGDYVQLFSKDYIILDKDYYEKALDTLSNQFETVFVFSDDIEWCKESFDGGNFVFIENEKDYIDLYLMSMCDHNIISNSSFSWWGAWLNKNKEKVVIAPKQWYGPNKGNRNLDDLLVSNWVLL
jgi:hypothetical protein